MMGWYHGGLGWGGWLLMAASMIAFWGLVTFAVVAVFRSTRRETDASGNVRRPQEILDERFARGEIEEPEYQARARMLRTPAK